MRASVKRWGAALLLFVAPVACYLGWVGLQRWRADAYAREALSALTYCLMGVAPATTDNGEDAAQQLRAVAIGGDLAGDDTWPGRCEPFVASADRALSTVHARAAAKCGGTCCAGDARCEDTTKLRHELARARQYLAIEEKSAFDADELVRAARRLGLLTDASQGAPEPPRAAALLDHRTMHPLYVGDYLRLLTDPAGDASLSLLFYEQDLQYGLCRFDLGGGASSAACGPLPNTIPVGMAGELLASEQGAPERMYAQGKEGSGWVEALYDVQSGHEISRVRDRPSGGFVWKNGTVAHLTGGALTRLRGGVVEDPVPLETSTEVSSPPRLIWDEVVWAEKAGDGRHRLLARRALADDEPLGPLRYLGLTPPLARAPSVEVCRTDDVLALLVGANDDKGGVDAVLLFRDASGWRPPVDVKTQSTQFGFTCRGDTATLSWIVGVEELPDLSFIGEVDSEASLPVRGRYAVHRLRCAEGHCKHDHVKVPLERFSATSRYVAGDAGDAMVVLWRSRLGDVRMKIGPLATLADAPERSVFDDPEHDGFGWDLERDPIIGRSGSVVVLLSRQLGVTEQSATYGFVVVEAGDITPVTVANNEL